MNDQIQWLPSFSLRTLLLLVTFACIAVATTVSASEQVHWGLMIVSVLLPTLAIPLAIYLRGNRQAFWIGVAIFGIWTYVLMHPPSGVVSLIYRTFKPTIKNLVGDPIADLHGKRIESLAYDDLRKGGPQAGMSIDEIKARFPERWRETVASNRNNLTDCPAYLAWDNLQLAISI